MNDMGVRNELPAHLILSAFCKMMTERPKVGKLREPIAENTKLGWIIMSPGCEGSNHMLNARTSLNDQEELCKLDVLGLEVNLIEEQKICTSGV